MRRASGRSPDPRQRPFRPGSSTRVALSAGLWLPRPFRVAAFASWVFLSRCGMASPLRVTDCPGRMGRPRAGQTASGLPRSALLRGDGGGCPLCPGATVSPPSALPALDLDVTTRVPRPGSVLPSWATIVSGRLESRDLSEGSLAFTRPAFPWPGASGWLARALGVTPGFVPHRYQ